MTGIPGATATQGGNPHGGSSPGGMHPHDDDEATIPIAPVTEALRLFGRAVRANQLYLPNNPMHAKAIEAARAGFAGVWQHTDVLPLTVTETAFLCEGQPALEELGRSGDSLPWLFYKDGIRTMEMRPGFETDDLVPLLTAVQRARTRGEEDDLLTMFWEHEFTSFTYQYVDMATDGTAAPGAELLMGGAPAGTIDSPIVVESENEETAEEDEGGSASGSRSPFARIEDFDSTLYFLDDQEITYLQNAIRDEFARDVRPPVVDALLDTFEQEEDPTVREEISGILENFLLVLLSNLEFRSVAYLLREGTLSASRTGGLVPAQQERLMSLAGRMSDPTVLTQLLQTLEDTPLQPPQNDLNELLAQLQPAALAPLLSQIGRTEQAELRALLETAATRLASSNTEVLVQLIDSDDEAVALEAIRRAGALRSPAAVNPLAKTLIDSPDVVRRAAVTALANVGSAGAMQALERAVEDADRDIRMTAVRAIAERQHRAGLARIERILKDRVIPSGHAAEESVFFDAYAVLAGDNGVVWLDNVLNPRGFLAKKEETHTRACAATALGKIGSPRALDALRKASGDKDVVVRNAAARAMRGGAA